MSDALPRSLRLLARLPALALIGFVRFYQVAIGPWLPPSCRFTPSCSAYAILAIRQYGAAKGFVLATWRILRCNPFGGRGYDPPRWFGEPDLRFGERLPEAPACGCAPEPLAEAAGASGSEQSRPAEPAPAAFTPAPGGAR